MRNTAPLIAFVCSLALLSCSGIEYTIFEPDPPVCSRSCEVQSQATLDNTTSTAEQLGFSVEIIAWGKDDAFPAGVDKNQRTIAAGAPLYSSASKPGTGRVWLQPAHAVTGELNTNAATWILNPPSVNVLELGYALRAVDVRDGRRASVVVDQSVELRNVAYGEELLVGAPGSYDGTGALEWYESQGSDVAGWQRGGEVRPAGGVSGERFGAAIAIPHLFDAMYPDATVTASPPWIAVGAPGKDKVYLYAVVPGSSTPLTLLQVVTGPAGTAFGSALAIADFDLDGWNDLAVGGPAASGGAGRVYLYRGQLGLTPIVASSKATLAPMGVAAAGGEFGSALAAGFIRRNEPGRPGLVVGVPGHDNGAQVNVGALCQYQFITQASTPVALLGTSWQRCDANPTPEANERWAHAVAVGNFQATNGGGGAAGLCATGEEIAVGIPGESGVASQGGAVRVLPHGKDGAEPAASGGSTVWGTRTSQKLGRALVADYVQRNEHEDLVIGSPLYASGKGSFTLTHSPSPGGEADPISGTWSGDDSGGHPFEVYVSWDATEATLQVTMLENALIKVVHDDGTVCKVAGYTLESNGQIPFPVIPWISTAATHSELVTLSLDGNSLLATVTFDANTGKFKMAIDERGGALQVLSLQPDCHIPHNPFVFTQISGAACD